MLPNIYMVRLAEKVIMTPSSDAVILSLAVAATHRPVATSPPQPVRELPSVVKAMHLETTANAKATSIKTLLASQATAKTKAQAKETKPKTKTKLREKPNTKRVVKANTTREAKTQRQRHLHHPAPHRQAPIAERVERVASVAKTKSMSEI